MAGNPEPLGLNPKPPCLETRTPYPTQALPSIRDHMGDKAQGLTESRVAQKAGMPERRQGKSAFPPQRGSFEGLLLRGSFKELLQRAFSGGLSGFKGL